MKHGGDLDALDNFLDKKEDDEIEWDLEDMKDAILRSAEDQWDKYAGG